MYVNTVSANYVTDCAEHFSFYLRLDFQLLKTPLCKNLGSEKTSRFCRKTPLASSEASATPCFKKLSGALTTIFDIKYYENIWIHVICVQVLAHFITPSSYFDRVSIISV